MLTYRAVRNVNITLLDDAVSDWRAMSQTLEDRAESAKRELNQKAKEAEWVGQAATAGAQRIRSISEQVLGASQLAGSIANLLASARDDLAEYRSALRTIAETAPDNRLSVDPNGRVRPLTRSDPTGDGPTPEVGDPDLARAAETELATSEWQQRIDDIIRNANTTDQVTSRAMRAALGDEDARHFTTDGVRFEDEDEIEAVATAQKVVDLANSPDPLTAGQAARVALLLRTHGEDEDFADHVAAELGVEGLLDLEGQVDAHSGMLPFFGVPSDGGGTGVANLLATATRVPDHLADVPPEDPEFQEWMETEEGAPWSILMAETNRYGGQELDDGRVGYDRVVDLMEKSDQPYSPAYLDSIVEGIDRRRESDVYFGAQRSESTLVEDTVLDRAYSLIAQQPDAASMVLDPDRNDRITDAIEFQENPPTQQAPGGELPSKWREFEAPGMADAIEAAATGRPAGEEPSGEWPAPTEANARVAQHMVDYVTTPGEEDSYVPRGTPDFLRSQMANITAHYIPNINQAITDHTELPRLEPGVEFASRQQAEQLIRQAGQDNESFQTVMDAQHGFVFASAEYAANADMDTNKDRHEIMGEFTSATSHVTGILASEQAQQAHDEALDSNSDRSEKASEYFAVILGDYVAGITPTISPAAVVAMQDINSAIYADQREQAEAEAEAASDATKEEIEKQMKIVYEGAIESALEGTDENKDDWMNSTNLPIVDGFERGWGA